MKNSHRKYNQPHKVRLDRQISIWFPDINRSQAQKFIKNGLAFVNNSPIYSPHFFLKLGDEVELDLASIPEISSKTNPKTLPGDINIIYEDNNIIAINKPAGIIVHPAVGHKNDTLVDILLTLRPDLKNVVYDPSDPVSLQRPGLVHRLDKDTTGVIIFAKNTESMYYIAKQIEKRKVCKKYLALLCGQLERGIVVNKPLSRNSGDRKSMAVSIQGKEAQTYFAPIKIYSFNNTYITYAEVEPITGRMHQIRIHAKSINHPVLGDLVYFNHESKLISTELGLKRQMLHANSITLKTAYNQPPITITAPLPADFKNVIQMITNFGNIDEKRSV